MQARALGGNRRVVQPCARGGTLVGDEKRAFVGAPQAGVRGFHRGVVDHNVGLGRVRTQRNVGSPNDQRLAGNFLRVFHHGLGCRQRHEIRQRRRVPGCLPAGKPLRPPPAHRMRPPGRGGFRGHRKVNSRRFHPPPTAHHQHEQQHHACQRHNAYGQRRAIKRKRRSKAALRPGHAHLHRDGLAAAYQAINIFGFHLQGVRAAVQIGRQIPRKGVIGRRIAHVFGLTVHQQGHAGEVARVLIGEGHAHLHHLGGRLAAGGVGFPGGQRAHDLLRRVQNNRCGGLKREIKRHRLGSKIAFWRVQSNFYGVALPLKSRAAVGEAINARQRLEKVVQHGQGFLAGKHHHLPQSGFGELTDGFGLGRFGNFGRAHQPHIHPHARLLRQGKILPQVGNRVFRRQRSNPQHHAPHARAGRGVACQAQPLGKRLQADFLRCGLGLVGV